MSNLDMFGANMDRSVCFVFAIKTFTFCHSSSVPKQSLFKLTERPIRFVRCNKKSSDIVTAELIGNLAQSRDRFEPITNSLTVSSDDTLEDNVEFSIGTAILRVVGNLVQSCDHFESTQNDKLGISSHDT